MDDRLSGILFFISFFSLIIFWTVRLKRAAKKGRAVSYRSDKRFNSILLKTGNDFNLKSTESRVMSERPFTMYGRITSLSGKVDGVDIEIRRETDSESNHFGMFLFNVRHSLVSDDFGFIKICKESSKSRLMKRMGAADFTIGDEKFDNEIFLEPSRPGTLTSLLNSGIRKNILRIAGKAAYFEISNSWMKVRLKQSRIRNSDALNDFIAGIASISRGLASSTDIKQLLMTNVASDPVPGVRLNNLHVLLKQFPVDDETRGLLAKTISDSDIDVQIESARYLKETGMKHLAMLLNTRKDLGVEREILIVSSLGWGRHVQSIPVMKRVFSESENYRLKSEICKAFREFGSPELCPFLLEHITGSDYGVKIPVIEALGTCGTVETVEVLLDVIKNAYYKEVASAARNAIEEIQSRLGDVEGGWLSAAELSHTQGALSRVETADKGALSRVKDACGPAAETEPGAEPSELNDE